MTPNAPYVDLALALADAAGPIVRRHFRTRLSVDDKADASPVTIADRDAEAAMRRLIADAAPDHGVIGEEHGRERADADFVWVLDPIDGTKAYITGKPCFGTLIALVHRGRPVIGIIDQPITGERWLGVAGRPTTLNGQPISVRPCPSITQAAVYTTDPDMFEGAEAAAWGRVRRAVKLARYGADCYAYALLATGCVDLVVETMLKPYDYCALIPVIEGAGGIVTDWRGEALTLASDGRVAAAGDARVHAQALALLAGG